MATVTVYTAARMKAIEDASIVDGEVVGDDLLLKRYDETIINAGNVRGAQGDKGDKGDPGDITQAVFDGVMGMSPQGSYDTVKARIVGAEHPVGTIINHAKPGPIYITDNGEPYIPGYNSVIAAWLPCNGGLLYQYEAPELFDVIGFDYGQVGVRFRTPNTVDRFIYNTHNVGVGIVGGSSTHNLTVAQLPAHNHLIPASGTTSGSHDHAGASTNLTQGGNGFPAAANRTTNNRGDGASINHMPPYIRLSSLIYAGPYFA